MKPIPYMTAETHRLTDLPGEKHPDKCQSCGRTKDECPIDRGPSRWQEHDHHDKPEPKVVVLCRACSNKLIEQHPRLYSELMPNDPFPGCMKLCVDCRHRAGTSCSHPRAKSNGGPGVMLKIEKPFGAMVDGPKYRGPLRIWPSPAQSCEQREA